MMDWKPITMILKNLSMILDDQYPHSNVPRNVPHSYRVDQNGIPLS